MAELCGEEWCRNTGVLHVRLGPAPLLRDLQGRVIHLDIKICNVYIVYKGFSSGAGAAAAKSLQSCPTLCDHMDRSPPGSSVHGILQERTLEWVAVSFSAKCC